MLMGWPYHSFDCDLYIILQLDKQLKVCCSTCSSAVSGPLLHPHSSTIRLSPSMQIKQFQYRPKKYKTALVTESAKGQKLPKVTDASPLSDNMTQCIALHCIVMDSGACLTLVVVLTPYWFI